MGLQIHFKPIWLNTHINNFKSRFPILFLKKINMYWTDSVKSVRIHKINVDGSREPNGNEEKVLAKSTYYIWLHLNRLDNLFVDHTQSDMLYNHH